ncbi:HNH endonuclease family protein [Streptomyces sp. NPDC006464]|uniref:HNH endonuclease family protein n=1 Tax=Streptomyces sp. NPDC006464 TaxID=3154305 RepID=UPI0033A4E747
MIKNMAHGVVALALALPPLAAPSPAFGVPAPEPAAEVMKLSLALDRLPIAEESRAGYTRDRFTYWNTGVDPADGCDTRAEVLLAEATEAPPVAAGCELGEGEWLSYYDGQEVTDPELLAVDHLVPLAEAWDSGAYAWTASRRDAYANDQGAGASLVAVTARVQRSKADRDPRAWMPPSPDATCRYVAEWTGTKLRWGLSADQAEADALNVYAEGPCQNAVVHYTPVP